MTGAVTGARRWWWRGALALLVYAAVMTLGTVLHNDPDPVTVALVVVVLVAAGSVLVDSAQVSTTTWSAVPAPGVSLGRSDPRTAATLRLLEGHLTARQPDGALRNRLRSLADQVLRERHELGVDDPRADPLLGPDLLTVLREPPRRLTLTALEGLVHRIETL